MRIQIVIDSATTEETRTLMAACASAGLAGTCTAGLNGPEMWTVSTPMMGKVEAGKVMADLAWNKWV